MTWRLALFAASCGAILLACALLAAIADRWHDRAERRGRHDRLLRPYDPKSEPDPRVRVFPVRRPYDQDAD